MKEAMSREKKRSFGLQASEETEERLLLNTLNFLNVNNFKESLAAFKETKV